MTSFPVEEENEGLTSTWYSQSDMLLEASWILEEFQKEATGYSNLHRFVRSQCSRMEVLPERSPTIPPFRGMGHETEGLVKGTPIA